MTRGLTCVLALLYVCCCCCKSTGSNNRHWTNDQEHAHAQRHTILNTVPSYRALLPTPLQFFNIGRGGLYGGGLVVVCFNSVLFIGGGLEELEMKLEEVVGISLDPSQLGLFSVY